MGKKKNHTFHRARRYLLHRINGIDTTHAENNFSYNHRLESADFEIAEICATAAGKIAPLIEEATDPHAVQLTKVAMESQTNKSLLHWVDKRSLK